MTFDELLDQATDLLRRRGRISLRALKRQFELDDEALEDLVFELVTVLRVANDEGGILLVWSEDADSESTAAAASDTDSNARVETTTATEAPAEPVVAWTPAAAERRRLTVMFADLVGSTSLSGTLDPEDLREVFGEYQAACDRAVDEQNGQVAQHLGDGIVAYFGYPHAHEDDPRRAVRAGLALIASLDALNERLSAERGLTLSVRVGVHTGLAVVGETGGDSHSETLALGETPNVAARVQGAADPNTVTISAATQKLVEGFFEVESLGQQELPGVEVPVELYRVVGESGAVSRLDVAGSRGLTPFVGREAECAIIMERWDHAREGNGQAVLISGEAGIGKSRLALSLAEQMSAGGSDRAWLRCSPYHENSAFRPVIELLEKELEFDKADPPETKLDKLEAFVNQRPRAPEHAFAVAADLLSLPRMKRFERPTLSPEGKKEITFRFLVDWLVGDDDGPAFTVWEDIQWADPSTIELLGRVLEQLPTSNLLVMAVHRPQFVPPWEPRSHLSQLVLNRLSRSHVSGMIERITGGVPLPDKVIDEIVTKTDGNPLFVEEVTKLVLESDVLERSNGSYELRGSLKSLDIPDTLHDSLMARLDGLGDAKEVAQIGAPIGREFTHGLVKAVGRLSVESLNARLERLVDTEMLFRKGTIPDATYTFKHALVQETAYNSLLKKSRQEFHARIVNVIEEGFGEIVETQPEWVAHHCSRAGMTERAITYWHRAGNLAVGRSAHAEAINHLTEGLDLLATLPESTDRVNQEILMRIALGVPLTALRGYGSPEVAAAYGRARELCTQAGEEWQLVPAMYGLWRYYLLRAEYVEATDLSEQLLDLAEASGDPAHLVMAHRAIGSTFFYLGDLDRAYTHLTAVLESNTSVQSQARRLLSDVVDAWVTSSSYASWTLWLQGQPETALEHSRVAETMAERLSHPFSVALASSFASWLHQFRGEPELAKEKCDLGLAVSEENGFAFWIGWCKVLQGWAASTLDGEDHTAAMEDGLAEWQATGSRLGRSYFLHLLAECHLARGNLDRATQCLADAKEFVEETNERWWEPELHRFEGELALAGSPADADAAERCFRRALERARDLGAQSLELRAATSLGLLLGSQGRGDEVRAVLSDPLERLTEGRKLADFRRAVEVLEDC